MKKPNWTPVELDENYLRWRNLIDETGSHDAQCQCNRCMECFGLGELLNLFDEDEKVTAVIESNKKAA